MNEEPKFVNAKGELKPIETLSFDDNGDPIVKTKKLGAGARAIIKTKNSTYEMIFIEPRVGKVLIKGGKIWPEQKPAFFDGCNFGGSILSPGGLGVGLYMEIWPEGGKHRVISTAIHSFKILDADGTDQYCQ